MSFILYSKQQCPQCEIAERFLKSNQASYTVIKLGDDLDVDEFKAMFPAKGLPVPRSVPVIYAKEGNTFLYGVKDLMAFFAKKGK